jgi:hypothetical protein
MKNLLLSLLLIISLNSYSAAVVNIWYVENDSATTGQSFSVFIKGSSSSVTDTARIYIKSLSNSNFVEVFKVNLSGLLATNPTGPNSTYELEFLLPSGYTKDCEIFSNYTVSPRSPLYVSSNVPDFTIVGGYGSFSGPNGFSTHFKVSWTYRAMPADSIDLYLDGSVFKKIAIVDIEADSIITFQVTGTIGGHKLTSNYFLNSGTWIDYTINLSSGITKYSHSAKDPEIKYYNEVGLEIEKPDHGFCLWKTATSSGKIYIE